jgi:hypothetical protein
MQSGHAKTAACIYSRSSCNVCYNVLNLRLLNYLFLRANNFEAYPRCPETSIHPTGKCWKVQHAMGHWAWTPCEATDLWSVGLEVHHWIVAKPSPFWCLMPLLNVIFIIYLHISSLRTENGLVQVRPTDHLGTLWWRSCVGTSSQLFPEKYRALTWGLGSASERRRSNHHKPEERRPRKATDFAMRFSSWSLHVTSCHFVCRKIMLCSCRPPGIKLHSHQLLHSWTLFNSERLPGFCGRWYQWSCVTPREETSPCDIVQQKMRCHEVAGGGWVQMAVGLGLKYPSKLLTTKVLPPSAPWLQIGLWKIHVFSPTSARVSCTTNWLSPGSNPVPLVTITTLVTNFQLPSSFHFCHSTSPARMEIAPPPCNSKGHKMS